MLPELGEVLALREVPILYDEMPMIVQGDALELLEGQPGPFDLIATDPPYAFSGSGAEHQLSATVAIVLREAARKLMRGGWMVCFAASSWRSTQYVVDSVRGILEPVRHRDVVQAGHDEQDEDAGLGVGVGQRHRATEGKSIPLDPSSLPDHIIAQAVRNGRRAELPPEVARWAVSPFVVKGGLMLDPFAGSGQLVTAARECGMTALGFELNLDADPSNLASGDGRE